MLHVWVLAHLKGMHSAARLPCVPWYVLCCFLVYTAWPCSQHQRLCHGANWCANSGAYAPCKFWLTARSVAWCPYEIRASVKAAARVDDVGIASFRSTFDTLNSFLLISPTDSVYSYLQRGQGFCAGWLHQFFYLVCIISQGSFYMVRVLSQGFICLVWIRVNPNPNPNPIRQAFFYLVCIICQGFIDLLCPTSHLGA